MESCGIFLLGIWGSLAFGDHLSPSRLISDGKLEYFPKDYGTQRPMIHINLQDNLRDSPVSKHPNKKEAREINWID